MISYQFGKWGFLFLFRCRGSVSRKALALAIPSSFVCLWIHHYYHDWLKLSDSEDLSVSQVWAGYNWALAFLLAFRTQQAYGRYWEGVSLLQQVRGEWFNATSSLIAFCAPSAELATEVERFQHLLVRLVSLLYCAGLQTVSDLDDAFRVIDNDGMEDSSLLFLEGNCEKCEIIIQWIQRLIIDNTRSGVVPVPAPIVSRVFQELSRGIVNLNNARKIADIPFPFPYAQMASIMLGIHLCLAPILAAVLMQSPAWAIVLTFFPIWALWGLNYIAAEIEAPFGDDPNDLPLVAMMDDMNTSLWMLLDKRTQLPPSFSFEKRHTQFKSTIYSSQKPQLVSHTVDSEPSHYGRKTLETASAHISRSLRPQTKRSSNQSRMSVGSASHNSASHNSRWSRFSWNPFRRVESHRNSITFRNDVSSRSIPDNSDNLSETRQNDDRISGLARTHSSSSQEGSWQEGRLDADDLVGVSISPREDSMTVVAVASEVREKRTSRDTPPVRIQSVSSQLNENPLAPREGSDCPVDVGGPEDFPELLPGNGPGQRSPGPKPVVRGVEGYQLSMTPSATISAGTRAVAM